MNLPMKKRENRGLEKVHSGVLRLCGALGSPYSNKMLMYLRFRRIPHLWIIMHSPEEKGLKHPKGPILLPKIVWPDGSAMNDSTFLIQRLEKEYSGRAAIPSSPGVAFLQNVLEDFADEFLTKCMYHYRWTKDPFYAGRNIVLQQLGGSDISDADVDRIGTQVRKRQVGRLKIVGSNDDTGRTIEDFYEKFMRLMEKHLKSGHAFLLGSRPSAADFAILGQIHPMISLDPETSFYSKKLSDRVCSWYHSSMDLSGFSLLDESKGWIKESEGTVLPDTLREIFSELLGDRGEVKWTQPTFRYQSKCVRWLREDFEALPRDSKRFVRRVLNGTGVLKLFDGHHISKL